MRPFVIALVCLCALVGTSAASSSNSLAWRTFKRQHGKSYQGPEDAMRLAIFLKNKELVERHNAKPEASFSMQLNHMADWSAQEFQKLNGFKLAEAQKWRKPSAASAWLAKLLDGPVPAAVDWREVPERVTEVKNQGRCGSCWAFSTTGLLEGQEQARNFSRQVALSEQELVDCSIQNHGCKGGSMPLALEDIAKKLHGIESEQDYPYDGSQLGRCRMQRGKAAMTIKGGHLLEQGDEEALLKAVANYGPVAVAIDATDNLMHYRSGVLNDTKCSADLLNHGVLVVGYGHDAQHGDFWIIKNSWGPHWGEKGYFRMKRGVNMCGVAEYPTVADF